MLDGEEIDGEIRTEPIAHVGQYKIEGIQLSPIPGLLVTGHHKGPLKTKKAPAAINANPTR